MEQQYRKDSPVWEPPLARLALEFPGSGLGYDRVEPLEEQSVKTDHLLARKVSIRATRTVWLVVPTLMIFHVILERPEFFVCTER